MHITAPDEQNKSSIHDIAALSDNKHQVATAGAEGGGTGEEGEGGGKS